MPIHRTLPRAVVATMAIMASVTAGPTSGAGAQECADVVSFARATATVARVDASSGAALAAPATYSSLIYDSIPNVAYNQSGPTTLGQLEDPTGTNPNTFPPTIWGFMPVDPPFDAPKEAFGPNPPFIPAPPAAEGRAEAAYPTLQGIPQDSENAAGVTQAEAHAYPTYSQGRASSTGLGGAEGGVRNGSSFTHATMECETLTLVVGWEANGLVTPGGTIPSMNQVATLVVSPKGATVDVVTNVAEETEDGVPVIDGQPLQNPALDEFNAQGTYVDVGEPRVTVEEGRATVHGGGVRYGSADPERNDTYTFYTIGSLSGEVELISVLPAGTGGGSTLPIATPPTPGSPSALAPQPGQTSTQVVQQVGEPPSPSTAAQEFVANQVQLAGLTEDLTTGSFSLWPLVLGLLAFVIIARTAWGAADRGRETFPTAGFAVDWLRERGQSFGTTYLQW